MYIYIYIYIYIYSRMPVPSIDTNPSDVYSIYMSAAYSHNYSCIHNRAI